MKIIYVVNEGRFFLSHRLALALEAQRHDVEVVVVCGADTGEQGLADAGLRYLTVPMSRRICRKRLTLASRSSCCS